MAKKATPADAGIQASREDVRQATEAPDFREVQVEITKVLDDPAGKTCAYAKLRLGGLFEMDGLRIVNGENGLFCSMPARKGSDGKYYPTARALHDDFKGLINDTAVEAFHKHLQEQAMAEPPFEPEMSQ